MNTAAEQDVLAKFPRKKLSKCNEDTNYVELSKVQKDVYKSLSVIPSQLNGNHGHLGLAMENATYVACTGAAFVEITANLGAYDTTIGPTAGTVNRARQETEHDESRRVWHVQHA
eukprot:6513087-Ditylum_brightwellii.AAC.1